MPAVLQPNAAVVANLRRRTVGDEDIAAAKGHAAGILFVAPDGDVLLLRRSPKEANFAGHWALPGGGVEAGESPEDGALREAREEMGWEDDDHRRPPLKLIDQKITPTGLLFHTFAMPVDEKFTPKLNAEHTGFDWSPLNKLPSPMHPAVQGTLNTRLGLASDMSPEDWEGMVGGLLKFLSEEAQEPEHAGDAEFNESDHPRAPDGKFGSGGGSSKGEESPHPGKFEAPKHADLKAQGLKPKGRASDTSMGQTALVAWKVAQQTGKDATAAIGGRGWRIVGPGAAMPYGTPHLIVSPEGKLRFYQPKPLSEDHAMDIDAELALARDEGLVARESVEMMALDRESVRTKDMEGRLHVSHLNISKACVNPYKGSEIPGWSKLGLEKDKIYYLLRDPEELAKAAATANGVQILRAHKPIDAANHKPSDVVGAVGSNAAFEYPYLTNSATFWPAADIDGIESGKKKQLSMGYRYTPDMTPGNWKGSAYDGVMRDIICNHVALVEDGRAGSDVCVADSADEMRWAKIEAALRAI
jgi:8-oxo-dGTP pyrophosphatase MutT (NUDIX family)